VIRLNAVTDFNADKTHLTNVIYNLIDNALKYTNEGLLLK